MCAWHAHVSRSSAWMSGLASSFKVARCLRTLWDRSGGLTLLCHLLSGGFRWKSASRFNGLRLLAI